MNENQKQKISPSKLNNIAWEAAKYIDDLYLYFDVDVSYRNEHIIKSTCPVHGGDNNSACNMYPNGDTVVHWKCRTHGCERTFGATMIGFIRGCLSRKKYGWSKKGDKTVSLHDAVNFTLNYLNKTLDDIHEDTHDDIEKLKFSSNIWNMFGNKEEKPQFTITREQYRSNIHIPAQYYIERGYSMEILDKYDVGFCNIRGKKMYKRAVVPVYDENHEYIIGFTGRSIYEQCDKCKHYHDPNARCRFSPKWRHSKGFIREKSLYNSWYAKKFIEECKVAIIVESPGVVWKLEEAGIHISLGMFGTAFNTSQKAILDTLGAYGIIILTDYDRAGRASANSVKEACENECSIHIPDIKQDIDNLDSRKIKKLVIPYIESIKERYS